MDSVYSGAHWRLNPQMSPQMQRKKTQNHYISKRNKNVTMETFLVHARLSAGLIRKADGYVLRELYSSRTELIADALRRRLEELEGGETEDAPSPVELGKERRARSPGTRPHAPIARAVQHQREVVDK